MQISFGQVLTFTIYSSFVWTAIDEKKIVWTN